MFSLDDRLAQQLHRERLQKAEQERLGRAARRARRQDAQDEPPIFWLWRVGRLFARRQAIPAPQPYREEHLRVAWEARRRGEPVLGGAMPTMPASSWSATDIG